MQKGPSGGRRSFPDFGQYMNETLFKCFVSAAPFAWVKKEHWFVDKRDMGWDIFLPCLTSFNDKRKRLLRSVIELLLDESMSAWKPKTSKLGGLPSYTFEPRKPIPLGTMFRNGVEAITGILVFQDVVQTPEFQSRKKYQGGPSALPGRPLIPTHTAEILRQVEGANMMNKGWVGGDAWFGSIGTAVEVKVRLGIDSTWIIKNNTSFFPKKALLAMSARHGYYVEGNWVVFTAEISGVKLIAMAYAWSQMRISYFALTYGSTAKSSNPYRSHFENDYGKVDYKELPRPKLAEFLYEYLPLIDEHNRSRQDRLALEVTWPTKCCWFRLIQTVTGMCVVDLFRLYRNKDQSYLE